MGSNQVSNDVREQDERIKDVDQSPEKIASVNEGLLEGLLLESRSGRTYVGFLGIPYAERPERFQLAKPHNGWEGTRSATEYGARCIQKDSISKQVWGSEDCLFLNVFTPEIPKLGEAKIAKFPVVVFIHGGAFIMGSGDEYNGNYLLDKDVIVITLNYRLGVFGFLNLEDGSTEENLGLKDQLLALQWIQSNIISFGGDKSRVTLMGQSAGSACVHYHILSPLSRGLFSAAIMQSGTALSAWSYQSQPSQFIKQLSKMLKGPTTESQEIIDFFKSLDARVLAAGDYDYENWKSMLPMIFSPSKEVPKEGKEMFVTDSPVNLVSSKQFNAVPLIIGVTAQEGLNRAGPVLHSDSLINRFNTNWNGMAPLNLFYRTAPVDVDKVSEQVRNFYFGPSSPTPISMDNRDKVIDLFSDRYFFYDTFLVARLMAQSKSPPCPVFMYMFGFKGDNSMLNMNGIHDIMGVSHSDDLQYLFDTILFPLGLKPNSASENMSKGIVDLWTMFITNRNMEGIPLSSGNELWEPVQLEQEGDDGIKEPIRFYSIDTQSKMVIQSDNLIARLQFWHELLPPSIFQS